jgi:hypothetical protein
VPLDHALAVRPLLELRRIMMRVRVIGWAAGIVVKPARDIVVWAVGLEQTRRLLARAERRGRTRYFDVFDVARES